MKCGNIPNRFLNWTYDQDEFTQGYFKLLAKKLLPYGYEPDALVKALWHETAAMIKNNGSCTNEKA